MNEHEAKVTIRRNKAQAAIEIASFFLIAIAIVTCGWAPNCGGT